MTDTELTTLVQLLGGTRCDCGCGSIKLPERGHEIGLEWLTTPDGMVWIRQQLAARNLWFCAATSRGGKVRVSYYRKGYVFVAEAYDPEEVEANALAALATLKELAAIEKGANHG